MMTHIWYATIYSFITHWKDCVQSHEHVAKLLLLFVSQRREEALHLPGLEIRDLENVPQQELRVNQAGPWEEVNQAEKNILIVTQIFKFVCSDTVGT